ncbi:hypothetical protein [Acinetobacter entericus]|uniref:Uncharacterized protein n=1 Tax=Acinetobacter entericus TaxID=2989714 RepID=A0ABT3NEG4_9GAMM|nr:hypothetical protein [Acinetobacter entericus]MCW8037938.1 hypothetical protein [Acinetobacter entericus]
MKLNNLSMGITLVNSEPDKHYPPAVCWQDVEKSLVCQKFAEFMDSWDTETLQIAGRKTEADTA